jgi:hypothetical protein
MAPQRLALGLGAAEGLFPHENRARSFENVASGSQNNTAMSRINPREL